MRYSLCTRTADKDYAWEYSTPAPSLKKAQEYFGFLDGSIANEFAVLFRLPDCDNVVSLIIAVPTTRRDNRGRVIRSIAMLYGETPDEDETLASFYSRILKTNDDAGLKNAGSDIALAIEEIVTTGGKSFERLNKLVVATRLNCEFESSVVCDKKAFPRSDMSERRKVAAALGSILSMHSFFIAIPYYRKAQDFVAKFELNNSKTYVRIFSPDCLAAEVISTDYGKMPTIVKGGVAAVALVAATVMHTCSQGSSNQNAKTEGDENSRELFTNNAAVASCTSAITKTAQSIQSFTNNTWNTVRSGVNRIIQTDAEDSSGNKTDDVSTSQQ